MPQMSPYNWLMLDFFFSILLMILISFIYFIIINNNKFLNNYKNKMPSLYLSYKLKW